MIDLEQFKHCNLTDIETTGLVPGKHGIVSIAAVNLINNDIFYEELQLEDGIEYDEFALNVNGFSKEQLLSRRDDQKFLTLQSALHKFEDYCSKHKQWVVVGKNPKFDYNFIEYSWKKYIPRKFPLTYRVINWADMALPLLLLEGDIIPKNGISSDVISQLLGVEKEAKPHTALNGAIQNKKCLLAIIEKYNNFALTFSK